MITASQILEEYLKLYKVGDKSYTIFLNPDRSERREMGYEIRFFADAKHKKLYAWDARFVTHAPIAEFLHLDDTEPTIFGGVATNVVGYKYFITNADGLVVRASMLKKLPRGSTLDVWFQEFFKQDWSWLDRYIKATPFLSRIKNKLIEHGFSKR